MAMPESHISAVAPLFTSWFLSDKWLGSVTIQPIHTLDKLTTLLENGLQSRAWVR